MLIRAALLLLLVGCTPTPEECCIFPDIKETCSKYLYRWDGHELKIAKVCPVR
jgi:hypothetical protein